MTGVLRSDIRHGKMLPNVLIAPLHSKQSVVAVENDLEDVERKENLSFRSGSCNAILINRKEPPSGPSHSKRAMRVSSALQVRGGNTSRQKKSCMKKGIYWTGDKIPKYKQFNQKSDGANAEETVNESETRVVNHCENERTKLSSVSDQCLFRQSPKRLKVSKGGEDGCKMKLSDWPKEQPAVPGPSCSDIVTYTKLNRPASNTDGKKRINNKNKQQQQQQQQQSQQQQQQLSPIKFKKSLEKRRGSDASRKKSKTLFKKSGKIILTNDGNKNSVERKRRKN